MDVIRLSKKLYLRWNNSIGKECGCQSYNRELVIQLKQNDQFSWFGRMGDPIQPAVRATFYCYPAYGRFQLNLIGVCVKPVSLEVPLSAAKCQPLELQTTKDDLTVYLTDRTPEEFERTCKPKSCKLRKKNANSLP